MSRERKAKRADFKRMKRLSRPRGLAWGPHARKLERAKTEREKQQTKDVARWHRATLVLCTINCFVMAIVRIFGIFLRALEKGRFLWFFYSNYFLFLEIN